MLDWGLRTTNNLYYEKFLPDLMRDRRENLRGLAGRAQIQFDELAATDR
jgi:hypothetical protein